MYVRFLILSKVLIYSGCQMSASLTAITSITASTKKLIVNLGSYVEKAHHSFLLAKTNLTFRLLQKSFAKLVNFLLPDFGM